MKEKSSVKKKIIIALCVIGALVLLVGSFFLRDVLLRAGLVEYDSKEIISVKNKYSATLDMIVKESIDKEFTITSKHGGLFQKSEISVDESGKPVYEKLKSHIDVLCHSYCYSIVAEKGTVTFTFNVSGSKKLTYSETEPVKEEENDVVNNLKDNWYYIEIGEREAK